MRHRQSTEPSKPMQLVRRIVNGQFKDVYIPVPATPAPASDPGKRGR